MVEVNSAAAGAISVAVVAAAISKPLVPTETMGTRSITRTMTIAPLNPPIFSDALGRGVLVFDGAMGTEIYRHHVFTNRSFDELCLSEPS